MSTPHRILVTGATGFIGQHVHRALLDAGHEVVAVIRPGRRTVPLDPRTNVARADLLDPAAMSAAVEGATAVVHLAGAVRGSTRDDFQSVNVQAVGVLRDVLRARPEPLPLLLMSSLAASVPELSDYSASKRAGEDLITREAALHWCAIRPPAVYGPGDRELRTLLALLVRGVVVVPGNEAQRLSFVHVEDLASACVHWLASHAQLKHRVFTIDDGRTGGYDWPAIVAEACPRVRMRIVIPASLLKWLGVVNGALADRLGRPPMLSPGKVRELMHAHWVGKGDTEGNLEFAAATGWQPLWAFGPGVRQTLGLTGPT